MVAKRTKLSHEFWSRNVNDSRMQMATLENRIARPKNRLNLKRSISASEVIFDRKASAAFQAKVPAINATSSEPTKAR